MKVYKDISEVIKDTFISKRLKEYDNIMKEIPNFDKGYVDNSKKIYEEKEYVILEVKSSSRKGYILYNRKKKFENGHTHLKSFNMAKVIISNNIHKKKPKTNNLYLLESHIRVSNDDKYIKFIKNLINVKKNKSKGNYINRKERRKKK